MFWFSWMEDDWRKRDNCISNHKTLTEEIDNFGSVLVVHLSLLKIGDLDLSVTLLHSIHTEAWGVSKEGISSDEKARSV